jgi:hypothetical protein
MHNCPMLAPPVLGICTKIISFFIQKTLYSLK